MKTVLDSLLKSRRFWAAVALIVVPILNDKFSFGLTEEQFITAAIAVVGWIVGESIRSSQLTNNDKA